MTCYIFKDVKQYPVFKFSRNIPEYFLGLQNNLKMFLQLLLLFFWWFKNVNVI